MRLTRLSTSVAHRRRWRAWVQRVRPQPGTGSRRPFAASAGSTTAARYGVVRPTPIGCPSRPLATTWSRASQASRRTVSPDTGGPSSITAFPALPARTSARRGRPRPGLASATGHRRPGLVQPYPPVTGVRGFCSANRVEGGHDHRPSASARRPVSGTTGCSYSHRRRRHRRAVRQPRPVGRPGGDRGRPVVAPHLPSDRSNAVTSTSIAARVALAARAPGRSPQPAAFRNPARSITRHRIRLRPLAGKGRIGHG